MFQKSKLSDFFEENTYSAGSNTLVIDFNNLMYRTLSIANIKVPDDLDFSYWKHLFVNNIFSSIKQFEPNKIIFAIDSKCSWRKGIYKEYKEGRKEARNKSTIDFPSFFKMLDVFVPEFKESFRNAYFMEVFDAEADDIIATLIKERLNNDSKITLISTDKDFIQLLTNKKLNFFNPIKKENVVSINPIRDLQIKILMGDKSDNIPSICRGVGPVRAAKIVDGDMNSFLNENENYKRIYELNKALIDFDFIPVDIKHSILKKYDTYELREYNGMKLWGFLCKNKLEKLADDLNIIGRFLKKITKNG